MGIRYERTSNRRIADPSIAESMTDQLIQASQR